MGGGSATAMINLFILEDHEDELTEIRQTCQRIRDELQLDEMRIRPFRQAAALKKHLPEPGVENVFILDIEISGDPKAGLELSRIIREYDAYATIIFLTVHEEFLYTTYKYQVEALDFIKKNYRSLENDLRRDFEKVLYKQNQQSGEMMTFHKTSGYIRVAMNDILFFTTSPTNTHQSILYTRHGRQTINANLREIEYLDQEFFRTQRSWLVNLNNISSIDIRHRKIHLIGTSAEVPLSRLKIRPLLEKLGQTHHDRIEW